MAQDLKNPRQEDIDWVKENILDKLVKDRTVWQMRKFGTSVIFNKVNKTFAPTELSTAPGSFGAYGYTKVILEKLGWKEVQTDFLSVQCVGAGNVEEEIELIRGIFN